MNYLHRDSPAPMIAFEEDGIENRGRRTHWRLVYADHRYGGRAVEDEERHYAFVEPAPTNDGDA